MLLNSLNLSNMIDDRVNMINADHVAKERGINFSHTYKGANFPDAVQRFLRKRSFSETLSNDYHYTLPASAGRVPPCGLVPPDTQFPGKIDDFETPTHSTSFGWRVWPTQGPGLGEPQITLNTRCYFDNN